MAESIALKGSGARLKELREQYGRTRKEMARNLGLTTAAYYKNENSETFPGGATLTLLEKEYDISMDWLIFGKGPMCYNKEKQRVEVLEKEFTALKNESEQQKENMAGKLLVENKPGLKELLEYMDRVPLLYHKIMVYFQEFKMGAGFEAGAAVEDTGSV